ncbi:AI-2E family transporter [Gordonia sp. PP30]|uniref:AI-2E family transporter n=1 Tax=Gordonia sp. PP30 TaxID=2935861 RepID=UPI0020000B06|nr:AI-2E family transporter [Gordonia sp. PP30]UQE75320.1 AI-2E family transporter [Gordonia sp. PP30]
MSDESKWRDRILTIREEDDAKVSPGVRATAAWTWRLLVIGVGIVVLGWLFKRFEDVLFPVALALLFTAFLRQPVDWAHRKGVPRVVAVLTAVVLTIVVVLGLLAFAVQQGVSGGPQLLSEFTKTVDQTRQWLVDSPLHLDDAHIRALAEEITGWAKSHEATLANHALGTAAFGSRVLTGAALTIFLLIFFLYDGRAMWNYVTRMVPAGSREQVRGSGIAGFGSLEAYTRATVFVAAVDAGVIGIGLAILGVPMVLPLVVIIFLGSFIPIVGSFVAGTLAVLVALTTQGWVNALIVVGLLIFVMAFEGHVLQPFILGHSVKLHPVAVILVIAIGLMLAGIVGGLIAVPTVAFAVTACSWRPGQEPPPENDSKLSAWIRARLHRGPGPSNDDAPAPS